MIYFKLNLLGNASVNKCVLRRDLKIEFFGELRRNRGSEFHALGIAEEGDLWPDFNDFRGTQRSFSDEERRLREGL